MGVALLDLGRVDEAIPFLQAALSIRTEIDDLEQQHVDLTHLAVAALRGGRRDVQPRSLDSSRVVVTPPTACTATIGERSTRFWKP